MSKSSEIRRGVYEKISLVTKILSSAPRLRIAHMLAQGPRSVEALSELTEESLANTSQHLQKFLQLGLVRCRKQGTSRIYYLDNPLVLEVLESLENLAHSFLPELEKAENELADPSLRSPLSAMDWIKPIKSGEATFVDVREASEASFSPAYHSIHISLSELKERSSILPCKPVVVICRGRYCSTASAAVKLLRAYGFEAYRLRESVYRMNQLMEAV